MHGNNNIEEKTEVLQGKSMKLKKGPFKIAAKWGYLGGSTS